MAFDSAAKTLVPDDRKTKGSDIFLHSEDTPTAAPSSDQPSQPAEGTPAPPDSSAPPPDSSAPPPDNSNPPPDNSNPPPDESNPPADDAPARYGPG